MKRIILEFNGSREDFQSAIDSNDGAFTLNDNIFYQMDYGCGEIGTHDTEFGYIDIRYEEED